MIKNYIKKAIKNFGYSLNKSKKFFDFNKHNINCVLDIGAHKGEFVKKIRDDGYSHEVISFEPQKDIHNLLKQDSKFDDKWKIYPRCIIGKNRGKSFINIFSETQCSSVLNPNKNFFDHDENFKEIKVEECEVEKLENIINELNLENKNIYLKIDTQGYESEVLEGCEKKIEILDFIQIEACVYNLYENEKTYDYYFEYLKNKNYKIWDIKPFAYNKDGRLLQFDAIFKNKLKKN